MENVIVIDEDGSVKEVEETKEEETNVVIIESASKSVVEETRSVVKYFSGCRELQKEHHMHS